MTLGFANAKRNVQAPARDPSENNSARSARCAQPAEPLFLRGPRRCRVRPPLPCPLPAPALPWALFGAPKAQDAVSGPHPLLSPLHSLPLTPPQAIPAAPCRRGMWKQPAPPGRPAPASTPLPLAPAETQEPPRQERLSWRGCLY